MDVYGLSRWEALACIRLVASCCGCCYMRNIPVTLKGYQPYLWNAEFHSVAADGQPFYLVDRCEIAVFLDRAHGHRCLGDAQEEVVRTPA